MCTSPEQSIPRSVIPPHSYTVPRYVRASLDRVAALGRRAMQDRPRRPRPPPAPSLDSRRRSRSAPTRRAAPRRSAARRPAPASPARRRPVAPRARAPESPALVGGRLIRPARRSPGSKTGFDRVRRDLPGLDLLGPVARHRRARPRACAAPARRRGSGSAGRTGSACGSGKPDGGFAGLGRSPESKIGFRFRSTSGSGIGTADRSEIVYG